MIYVTLDEARERLPDLLNAEGETILIKMDSHQTVQIIPVKQEASVVSTEPKSTGARVPGSARGLFFMPDNFNDPLEDFEEYAP